VELYRELEGVTKKVFKRMLALEVVAQPSSPRLPEAFCSMVSGMVGLAGVRRGMVAIHLPEEMAKTVTSRLLQTEIGEVNEDVMDAVGELANMLAGNIKSALSSSGHDIKLSIPSVVSGVKYLLDIQHHGENLAVPFETEIGRFVIQLHFEQPNEP